MKPRSQTADDLQFLKTSRDSALSASPDTVTGMERTLAFGFNAL